MKAGDTKPPVYGTQFYDGGVASYEWIHPFVSVRLFGPVPIPQSMEHGNGTDD